MLIVIIFIICVVIVWNKRTEGKGNGTRIVRKAFMTQNELEFWHLLRKAAPPLNVGPQVAMGALLTTSGGVTKSLRQSACNRFDRQCVDFVLFDTLGEIQLIVELDDSTHNSEKDRLRDQRTANAGYSTLRSRRRDAHTVSELARLIAGAIPTAQLDAA